MNKSLFLIWKDEHHPSIRDHCELVGIFEGTYEEADELIHELNKRDDSVFSIYGRVANGYWRSEPRVLTKKYADEVFPQ